MRRSLLRVMVAGSQKFVDSPDALAAAMLACSARSFAQAIFQHAHRQCIFNRLDRRIERIGHVAVPPADAIAQRPAAMPAADGLVVDELPPLQRAAKGEIVHRPLAGRRDAIRQGLRQCAQHDIGHPLAGLGVAHRHRRRKIRVEQAVRRGLDLYRLKAAMIDRHIIFGQQAHTVPGGAAGDGVTALRFPATCGAVPAKSTVMCYP